MTGSMELSGRTALVTGAGRGLGEIISLALAEAGAAVALVARSQEQLERVAGQVTSGGGRAFVQTADVTDRAQVEAAYAAAETALGPIDILVNNAGVDEPFGPIGIVDPDAWWRTHAVHVLGPLYFMHAALPGMAERGKGHIINVCSMAGRQVVPNMSAYTVGKSSEIHLTQQVGLERAQEGVKAFAIQPGTILTSLAEHTINSPEAKRWIPEGIEFLKSISPEASEADKVRLKEMILQLVSGRYDALSGRYLEPEDDFDALLKDAGGTQ